MAKVLVLYYSAYGHIETMAYAVAEGAKSAGAEVTVKRVPELVPEDVAKASYYKVDQAAPIATVDELADYDAIMVNERWIGERTVKLQEQAGCRIAWIDRLGEGTLPTRESVLQEGDMLHLVMREENAEKVYAVIDRGPEAD